MLTLELERTGGVGELDALLTVIGKNVARPFADIGFEIHYGILRKAIARNTCVDAYLARGSARGINAVGKEAEPLARIIPDEGEYPAAVLGEREQGL